MYKVYMLVIVFVTMAIVVMGGMCVQSLLYCLRLFLVYAKYHGRTQHYPLPEAICVAMATCNLVGIIICRNM